MLWEPATCVAGHFQQPIIAYPLDVPLPGHLWSAPRKRRPGTAGHWKLAMPSLSLNFHGFLGVLQPRIDQHEVCVGGCPAFRIAELWKSIFPGDFQEGSDLWIAGWFAFLGPRELRDIDAQGSTAHAFLPTLDCPLQLGRESQ